MIAAAKSRQHCSVLITGGAGFVGVNLAADLLANGERVRILDSLARAGSERNIAWLRHHHPDQVDFIEADVRNPQAVAAAMRGIEHVVHLAAQVAVTSSLADPPFDFDVNAFGTLNVLEAARRASRAPSLIFTSTNKVYGALDDLRVRADGQRYMPTTLRVRSHGIDESRGLDFHSPYGCSKGAAEQYVLDYSRSFGLRTTVFRMSCIYGPHQHGNEDQGWVAHMVRSALAGTPITIYGNGKQVRDVLFVDDLVNAFRRARHEIDRLSGRAFNIGGGPGNSVSLLELIRQLEQSLKRRVELRFERWRVGDQRYYVSDTGRFQAATGWRARTAVTEGVEALCDWLTASELLPAQRRRTAQTSVQELGAPG
ncbi:NAD-dependent epimerase/dehydratase family protein [Peristeroidobacter agariperforans]|uniref:NAD-dependent epimerase/dehydratase family protein n=1 Tax=Peristeroidobacter agariperforans TaxID=268404 RepID=UPI0018E570F8|nr:NAD-dependent epimerase/dehydratase family protein [Peristeroidobacter agariperforans]